MCALYRLLMRKEIVLFDGFILVYILKMKNGVKTFNILVVFPPSHE